MALEEYLVPCGQLCWTCQNACGGCEWSSKLQPVPGWTAKKVTRDYSNGEFDSYSIKECPKYIPEPPRKMPRKGDAK